jgi:GxxExxY protein
VDTRSTQGLDRVFWSLHIRSCWLKLCVAGGLSVEPERLIPIVFDGIVIENGFRADIVVEGKLLIELKSIEKLAPIHGKQLLTYLRLAGLPVGLLMNFGQPTFKEGLRRIADGYDDRNTAYRRAALQKS